MSVGRVTQRNAMPAIDGQRRTRAGRKRASQPTARPRRLPEVDSVRALKRAAGCARAASPPITCHRNSGATLGVNAVASCDPAARTNEVPSRARAPKRSTRTPDGRESKAAARVETEKRAPTSNLLAPRSCAYSGTVRPLAERAANDAPAATESKTFLRESGTFT